MCLIWHTWEYLSHRSGKDFRHCTKCDAWEHAMRGFPLNRPTWQDIEGPPPGVDLIPTSRYMRELDKARADAVWRELLMKQEKRGT